MLTVKRRYPIGAEVLPTGELHFRVWAPAASAVGVEILTTKGVMLSVTDLESEPGGYFSGLVGEAGAGCLYRYRLPQGSFPDPASRFQPSGPHGPSEAVDPAFSWTDADWRGRPPDELIIYELHLGSFTGAGTWRAAMAELPELARLGFTMIEVMPIADFPGEFGWGYDGVDLFAPCRLYGTPNDARAFVNEAHAVGLMVILDVVYNHLGPDGCYLREFASEYFTTRYRCEWGDPLNFDGPDASAVREFFLTNARYWVEEFHFDGLRLDATQQIFDSSPTHILAEIAQAVRSAAPNRRTFLTAEDETQRAELARTLATGGYGFDAVWNDDFHHSATVASTGRAEAYYLDYRGTAQELVSACKHGFLFQGQWYGWQKKRRGTPVLDLAPQRFVTYLQNHDQIANSLRGQRLHQQSSPGTFRAVTALLLLAPSIPMLFQGQEFAASAPFLFFADHRSELASKVAAGRRDFLWQFPSVAATDAEHQPAPPGSTATFHRCKLNLAERQEHPDAYRLHEDLLKLRRQDPAIKNPADIDGAVLSRDAFVLRFFRDGDDRLLIVNLGRDLHLPATPEPLLAPLSGLGWAIKWSSESPGYGGGGTPPIETTTGWIIPGPAAFVLIPSKERELPDAKTSQAN